MQSKVDVHGATIAFHDSGQGRAILLVHGFPATGHLWTHLAPVLTGLGFRTIIPDLVGYGASTADPGIAVDMESQARWMLGLFDAVNVKDAIVIAHDVGSAVAQLMLAKAPHRVRGLAILDGAYEREWAMDSIASIVAWDAAQAHRIHPVLVRRLGKAPQMLQMLSAYEGHEGGHRLIRAARDLRPDQTAGCAEVLRAARKPALVIWGQNDRYLPLDTVARPLAEALGAPLVLVPGGHFSPIDCPDEVASALQPFLQTFVSG